MTMDSLTLLIVSIIHIYWCEVHNHTSSDVYIIISYSEPMLSPGSKRWRYVMYRCWNAPTYPDTVSSLMDRYKLYTCMSSSNLVMALEAHPLRVQSGGKGV